MADNLGEYKVVVSADYSNLQKSIADLLKSIQGSADDISGVFSKLTDNIEKSAVSSKAFDSVKGSIDEAKASVNALADQTKNAGNEAQSTSNKYKTLQASLREARTDAEKAFGTDAFDKARGSYDSILARMTAFKSAIGDTQEATARAEQSTQRAIEQSIAKRKEYTASLMATQNRQADTQYYKDIEAQQKRNSDQIKAQIQAQVDAENQQKKAADEAGKAQQKAMLDASKSATVYESVLSKVRSHLLWMASATVTGAMFAAPFEAVKTIADVEKQMAGMIQVLPQLHGNQLALNNVSQQFITIAEQYGMEVNKIIEAGKLWGRGYKDVSQIMQLTGLSAKLATADMMDVTLANRAVESTINSFGRQADAVSYASHIVDSWTNIAHNAQSSATDLAEALMRSGAAAHAVGVSLDTTNALASTMIKTTGLEGANIGNALKSIFSSIHSDKAIADLKALGIEVATFDQNGVQHFRDVSSVITDLMLKTHETSKNMAKDLQDISGGKFQWSKAAALFGDYADFIKAYNLSIQSTGFSEGQIAAQMDTISRKAEQLKATLTGVLSGAGDSGLSVAIKGMLTSVNDFLKGLQQIPASTYQSVGAIAKLGVEIYAGAKFISFLHSGVVGVSTAISKLQVAKATDTAATVANTLATGANATSKTAGATASRANAAAIGTEVITKEADVAATTEATAATGAWATATTIATGGVNLLIAGLIAAAVGTASYTESLGEEANAADTMAQKNSDAIAIKEQEVEMTEKQTEFIGTLGNAYIELSARLEQVKGNEEETNKTKKDLEATENELAKIVGEDGLERIKTSDDVSQAIQDEKKAHSEKTESIKNDLANLKKQQIEFTRQQLQGTVDRIDALKSEATAWTRFMDIVAGALDMYIGAQKFIFDHMPNFMQAQKSMLARSIDENTSYRESLRGGRSISTNNEIAELEQKKAEQEIKLAKLQISDETGYVPPSTTQTGGDVVPAAAPKKGKGAGRKPVDNSNERIAYDFFVRAGYSKELASGLVGNFMTESPGLIPTAWNESGTSYGIGQWQDSRLQGLYDFANTNKSDYSSLDTQLAYAVYELQHGESGSLSKVLASNPTTPEEAAYAFAKYYERPAVPENFERQQNARDIYGRYAMGEGGKYEALDPAKQREKFYSDMKKSYDEELQAEKNTALEQGRFWKANDTLYLFKTMLGEVGKDIPAYETERLKLQQEKQKEDQAILAATYARQEALTTAGVDNVKKAEEEIKAAVSAKQPLSGAQEKIYENMLKSGIAPKGSPEKLKADTDEYKEIFSRNNAIHKEEESVLKKHTSILESITDSETQFAQKLHMLSSEEVLQRNAQINESKYQQQLPELQAGLSKTAKTGNESAMLDAYKAFQNAKTAEDAKASIKTMASLSKDEVATLKAVSAMQEAYEKYATKREQLSEQEFERENRYQISFINAYQSAWSDALDSTLNKTRSFAENARNIFKSLFSALTKQLSTDFAQKWTQSLSKIMLASKSTSQQTKTDNQSMATQIEQNAAQVTAKAIQSDTQRKQSSQQLSAAEKKDSTATKVSVLEDIGTMLTSMLAEMAIMYALSAIFGGGGSSTSTSTSTVSLGRNPASYYKTPPTISQVTVPSMDIGGELPSDQLILAHKKEWVLTPDQISSLQAAGKSATSTSNNSNSMVFHSNFSPSLIDSRGIKDVYAQTRKDMIKTIKREVRGFNTTTVT